MINVIKLGTEATGIASGIKGMVTHLFMDIDQRVRYYFQPRGLSPETGQPIPGAWVPANRLSVYNDQSCCENVRLPVEALGTIATDTASGFTGMVISVTLHISGCVHLLLQPAKTLEKTGAAVESCDFDIRRLTGKAIPKLTEAERQADQTAKPSPCLVKLPTR